MLPLKRCLIVMVLFAVTGPEASVAAQGNGPEGDAERTGTVPTIFFRRLSVRNEYIKPVAGDYVNRFVLRGDYPVLNDRLNLRVDVPYVTTALPGGTFSGLGDIQFRAAWLVVPPRKFGFVVGSDFIFDTAQEAALGKGKYVAAPLAAVSYTVSRSFIVFAVAQYAQAFAGREERPDVRTLAVLPGFYYRGAGARWALLTPSLLSNFTAGGDVTFNTELEVGQMFSEHFGLSVSAGTYAAGEKLEEYSLAAEVRYLVR